MLSTDARPDVFQRGTDRGHEEHSGGPDKHVDGSLLQIPGTERDLMLTRREAPLVLQLS